MIHEPVNRSNAESTSTGGGPNALNVSNHGFGMNNSGHSCCSCSTRGGIDTYGNVSLSNIFADEEEQIDIFGENSMIGFITALQLEQNLKNEQEGHHTCPHHSGSFERKSPQKKNNSMKSIKTIGTDSTSTWQGSCNSFLGMGDELLDLSFTVNDFDKGNDDLSLHTKNTTSSCTSATKKIPRNLSRKDILLSNLKETANANSKVNIHGTARSTTPKVTNSLVVTGGGMHHCFDDENQNLNVDQSPRKPVRRGEECETLLGNEAVPRTKQLRDALDLLSNKIDIPNFDEESSSSEVIKINISSASRNEQGRDNSDRWDCRITDSISKVPLSCSSHSEGELSSKEDSAPKCPRRGKSPSRSVIVKPKVLLSENLGKNPTITNSATEKDPTECKSSPSPKKKVMKIAIKDLEKYISDAPETNGKIKSAISSLRYQKILQAAEDTHLRRRNENERVKISMNVVVSRDVGTSPYSTKCFVPQSIAVDSSDCSLSSMDDSSRSFIRETRYPPHTNVTPTRRRNNISPSKSSRFAIKSPSSSKQIVVTNVKSNSKTLNPKASTQISSTITSSTKGLPQILRRVKSCNVVDEVQVNIIDDSNIENFNGVKSSLSSSKKRYDSPIVRPAEYIFPPGTPTTPPNAATQITALSSPQRRKILVDTTEEGDCVHCLHHRDKPPTSPRRYITPTRGSRSK